MGNGRLDSKENPVFYCSTDLELCLHECRVSSEDQIYVGIFNPSKTLKLLDLSVILEEDCTEFESLDLSILMLFLASKHAYKVLQKLSNFIKNMILMELFIHHILVCSKLAIFPLKPL